MPITSTLMGLGAYPGSGDNWLGMLVCMAPMKQIWQCMIVI